MGGGGEISGDFVLIPHQAYTARTTLCNFGLLKEQGV